MAIKLNKLGGVDLTGEEAKSADMNDTRNAMVDLIVGVAEGFYKTLQSNNIFENKDFAFADEFTDSTGTNNTVNTGSTTAEYNIYDLIGNNYILPRAADQASGDTTHDPNSYTNPSNAFDSDDNTFAYKTVGAGSNSTYLGKTFSSKNVGWIRGVCEIQGGGASATGQIDVETYDGATWNFYRTIVSDTGDTPISKTEGTFLITTELSSIQGVRFKLSSNSTLAMEHRVFSLEYGIYSATSAIVVCDANIKTLSGSENSICAYGDKETPTNTNITVDVSDGTTTVSTQPLDELNNISSLSSGTLKLTYNLTATSTSISPKLLGYGGFIK